MLKWNDRRNSSPYSVYQKHHWTESQMMGKRPPFFHLVSPLSLFWSANRGDLTWLWLQDAAGATEEWWCRCWVWNPRTPDRLMGRPSSRDRMRLESTPSGGWAAGITSDDDNRPSPSASVPTCPLSQSSSPSVGRAPDRLRKTPDPDFSRSVEQ